MEDKQHIILPSIFAADVGRMESELQKIRESSISMIHYDVMDNHFVPNISFGSLFIEQVMKALPHTLADIHLMIELPYHWENYLKLRPHVLTIHLEAGEPVLIKEILKEIRGNNVKAGLSIKPKTPISAVKEYIQDIDILLIMSVEPGFSFQSFIPESLARVQEARDLCGGRIILEADGGITSENMADLKRAGLDWFVMGGGFFKDKQRSTLQERLFLL